MARTSPRFGWERALRDDDKVTGTGLLVLLTLATYMDSRGVAYPGQSRLAADTGLGVSTVRKHLSLAVRDGWLEEQSRGRRLGDGTATASRYRASQPLRGERLSDTSTATDDTLNRPLEVPQPPPSEHLSLGNIGEAAALLADGVMDLDDILAVVEARTA